MASPSPLALAPAAPSVPETMAPPPTRSAQWRQLDAGTCPRPPWNGVEAKIITDAWALEAFWRGTHPRKSSAFDAGAGATPLPKVDFNTEIVLVLKGRPGSGEIRLVALEDRGAELAAVYFNPQWPELAIKADLTPYLCIVTARRPVMIGTRETVSSLTFNRLVAAMPTLYRKPGGLMRDLELNTLDRVRQGLRATGASMLTDVWQLQAITSEPRQLAYTRLLEARVYEALLADSARAEAVYNLVVGTEKGTPLGQVARHHVHQARRLRMEREAMAALDETRGEMAAARLRSGTRWLETGGQYEYLTTCRPRVLYMAVECYREGAKDTRDPEAVQNCLLRAADVYYFHLNKQKALQMYGECVRLFPDARSVPVVLRRIRDLMLANGDPRGYDVYHDFLRRYPDSPRAAEVEALAWN